MSDDELNNTMVETNQITSPTSNANPTTFGLQTTDPATSGLQPTGSSTSGLQPTGSSTSGLQAVDPNISGGLQMTSEVRNLLQQILSSNQRIIGLQLEVEKHQMANAALQMRNELVTKELNDLHKRTMSSSGTINGSALDNIGAATSGIPIISAANPVMSAGLNQFSDSPVFRASSVASPYPDTVTPITGASNLSMRSGSNHSSDFLGFGEPSVLTSFPGTATPINSASNQNMFNGSNQSLIISGGSSSSDFVGTSAQTVTTSAMGIAIPCTGQPLSINYSTGANSTLPVFSSCVSQSNSNVFGSQAGFVVPTPASMQSSQAPIVHSALYRSNLNANVHAFSSDHQTTAPSCAYVVQHDQLGQPHLQLVSLINNIGSQATTSSSLPPVTELNANPLINATLPTQQWNPVDYRRTQELPQFSGQPEEWPLFKDTFEETTRMYRYTERENLVRLRRSLCGTALKSVESLLIHPHNVLRAMQVLERNFGQSELLVRSQLAKVRELPIVDEAHLDRLNQHAIVVENLAVYLDTAATQHHLANPFLLDELLGKLTMSHRLNWAAVAATMQPYPTLKEYAAWITSQARVVSLASRSTSTRQTLATTTNRTPAPKPQFSRGKHVLLVEKGVTKCESNCNFCKESHETRSCDKLLRLKVPERLREIAKFPLCYGCLGNDHLLPACQQRKRCGIDGCPMWHIPELHSSKLSTKMAAQSNSKMGEVNVTTPSPSLAKPSLRRNTYKSSGGTSSTHHENINSTVRLGSHMRANPKIETSTILNCREGKSEGTLLFRVVPVVLHGPFRKIRTYALLDEGSSVSLIDTDIADKLQLDGVTSELSVQWFGTQSTVVRSKSVTLFISGEQPSAPCYSIRNLRTVDNLKLPTQSVNRAALLDNNPHLRDVPFGCYEGAQPKILLGLDHHHLGVPRQTRTNAEEDGIVATDTKLGWIVYGSDGRSTLPGAVVMHIRNGQDIDQLQCSQLHELVREHFTTENFGVKVPTARIESDDVIRARTILDATTKRINDRFETGLLWRDVQITLPDSYGMALRRLACVESKMRKDEEYSRQYKNQIEAYMAKGYARMLTKEEANVRGARTWYLPHFAVSNPNKPGKFRLVFDAAAAVDGVSLNSTLLAGPDVNVPLTRLLFQFRLGAVGVCGDIKEMYHQVMVRQEDQDSQRFLWRGGDSTIRPNIYVMQVMTFGATCSPASAQHVKNVNAAEFEKEMPEAAAAIQRHHYVDDYVASFATPEDAIRITKDVIDLHRRGGFELRGIVSSSELVRKHFGDETESQAAVNLEPDSSTEKILGMSWDTLDDTFRFMTRFNRVQEEVVDGRRTPTKREILSTAMSIFDPFGLLSNFVLESKLILQDLWRLGVEWDDPIPEAINERWQSWRAEIPKTQLLRVPRCYSIHLHTTPDLQLHVFADASEVAFAAVAYWRIQVGDQVELAFVAGKARCAPVKLLSIPRLELQAAVLATRLMTEICESHDMTVSRTVLWSDSETVLKWLRSDQRKYKPFVAFRVAEVLESAPVTWWRWVPTSLNVADDGTRVRQPMHFEPNGRWTRGPEWLRQKEEHWPVQSSRGGEKEAVDEEARSKFIGIVSYRGPVDYARFSKFYRLCRAIAWARRFVSNVRQHDRDQRQNGELSSTEVNCAVDLVCRWVQSEKFSSELAVLRNKLPVLQGSQLFSLKPYLSDDGLMRVHGRTDAADEEFLPQKAKRPILLPDDHHFTRLLVRHHHERMAHQLVDATIAAVRERYWVPRLRTLVRKVQHECNACRIRNARPLIPSQGQLPKDRMAAYARPFSNTGLDYFGPIDVTIGRRHEKRWVALFTCLTVRAVHLEIAADLSTDACLMCIRNLCNVRGVPALIRCDNGTNFVGACNELAREKNFFDPYAIQRDLSTRGVEWRFNCPANPEAGGAWERLVQSVKRVLRVTLHEEAPRVETLRALLLEAANIVNSRPLTHLQVDPNDPDPLTPNHFLLGGPNVAMVPNPADVEPKATRKQWQICRGLSRVFWHQWVRDYLPEMTKRSKHYPLQPQLEPGNLVFVCDASQSRSKWMRGRIEEVTRGSDGVVRTATVKTKDGTLRRPITKLAVLSESPSPTESTDGGRDVANFPILLG